MTAPADPLLETITKAVRDGKFSTSYDEYAVFIYNRLLSDAGSTQWGVRWNGTEHVGSVYENREKAMRVVDYWTQRGAVGMPVRRQVLGLHGDWEDAT